MANQCLQQLSRQQILNAQKNARAAVVHNEKQLMGASTKTYSYIFAHDKKKNKKTNTKISGHQQSS